MSAVQLRYAWANRPTSRLVAVLAILLAPSFAACGASSTPRSARADELRTVSTARALELIVEVTGDEGLGVETQWSVELGPGARVVDARITQTSFGIEWATAQDRLDAPDLFPDPTGDGQLQLVSGAGDDQDAQVLVLDERTYQYDPDLARVQRGAIGQREAEGRLRRDLRDFVQYLRGQGL